MTDAATAETEVRYAELLMDWLGELGYTHCFFLAGGNNMHLLAAARTRMICVAFVHEVSAAIATEYFNAARSGGRAFCMVTAGPGLTQLMTALGGAFLESRELLVLGGQVKSTDLIGRSGLRQRGIQEIDGVAIAAPVCVTAERLEAPVPRDELVRLAESGSTGRPGPVFLEICLDVQGAPVRRAELEGPGAAPARDALPAPDPVDLERLDALLGEAERPLLLIGGGVRWETVDALRERLDALGVPLMTTWNGADRLGTEDPLYFGRPNTWGQRSANILLQQADVVVALGTRLGLQQSGFNWQAFVPVGRLVQVEIDEAELGKGHPRVDLPIRADANEVLRHVAGLGLEPREEWVAFCRRVRELVPIDEPGVNTTADGYIAPYRFITELSALTTPEDVVIPCSSGGANSSMMQAFAQKHGQLVITDKGLASMGYGLAGAIGAALAHPDRRTVLVEGDGGFAQNLQEIATAAVNGLNLKIVIFANEGYASIRSTQRNYFGGEYIGCDVRTGLGFPDWETLFAAYGVPAHTLDAAAFPDDPRFAELLSAPGPAALIVPVDPEQTYFPKIASRVTETGSMESNPLHLMTPELPDEIAREVFRYVEATV